MTTIQDRRREVENTINRLTAQREGCIASLVRFEGRLTLARRKLERIKRACIRALERDAAGRKPEPFNARADLVQQVTAAIGHPPTEDVTDIPVSELPIADRLDEDPIPAFLKRTPAPKKTDAELAAELTAANEAKKKAKSRGRIAKMKAKQAGDLKRMPLTGRAALEAIRNG